MQRVISPPSLCLYDRNDRHSGAWTTSRFNAGAFKVFPFLSVVILQTRETVWQFSEVCKKQSTIDWSRWESYRASGDRDSGQDAAECGAGCPVCQLARLRSQLNF